MALYVTIRFFIQVLKVMGVQANQLQALQSQIESWEGIINANINNQLRLALMIQEDPHEDIEKAITPAIFSIVIAFFLFRMKHLIKNHQKLAIAHLPDQITTLAEDKQFPDLIKLLHYSYTTFKQIEELQKQYNTKAERFDKINRNAVNALLTIIAIILIGSLALYIASSFASIPLMPIIYGYVASTGAALITMAIGAKSGRYANYLRNNKIPQEMVLSASEFYEEPSQKDPIAKGLSSLNCQGLLQQDDSLTDNTVNILQKRFYITSGKLSAACLNLKSDIRELMQLDSEQEPEILINYVLTNHSEGKHKITYFIKGEQDARSTEINKAEDPTPEEILAAIIKNQRIDGNASHKFKPRFFQNTFAQIMPQAGTADVTEDSLEAHAENFQKMLGM